MKRLLSRMSESGRIMIGLSLLAAALFAGSLCFLGADRARAACNVEGIGEVTISISPTNLYVCEGGTATGTVYITYPGGGSGSAIVDLTETNNGTGDITITPSSLSFAGPGSQEYSVYGDSGSSFTGDTEVVATVEDGEGNPCSVTQKVTVIGCSIDVDCLEVPGAECTESYCTIATPNTYTAVVNCASFGGAVTWGIMAPDTGTVINATTGEITVYPGALMGDVTISATNVVAGITCVATKTTRVGCCRHPAIAGEGYLYQDSAHLLLSMGKAEAGRTAGWLRASFLESCGRCGTPSGLRYSNPAGSDSEVLKDGDTLRQVLSHEALADIVTIDAYEYEVRFYFAANKGTKAGDFYQPVGDPFAVYTIENPDKTEDGDTILITKDAYSGGVKSTVKSHEFVRVGDTWQLLDRDADGNPLRTEQLVYSSSIPGNRTTVREMKDPDGVVCSGETLFYSAIAGHPVLREVLTQRVRDVDATNSLIDTYSYYPSAAGTNVHGRLHTESRSDGSWTIYEYDAEGRRSKVISSWLDVAMPTNPASVDESSVKVTEYSYATNAVSGSGDTGELWGHRPRAVTEKIEGHTVSKTYHAYVSSSGALLTQIVERAASPTAAFGTASNQRTTKTYYLSTDPGSGGFGGVLKSVTYPDGRMNSYTYTKGAFTANTNNPGSSTFTAGSGTDVCISNTHGTVSSPGGIAGKSTIEERVLNAVGAVRMTRTHLVTASGTEEISWEYNELDELNRPTTITSSSGTVVEKAWSGQGGCGSCSGSGGSPIEVTAADGTHTEWHYDALDRKVEEIREGYSSGSISIPAITNLFAYDVVGRQLSTRNTAPGISLLTTHQYDMTGRTLTSTDPGGSSTLYTYDDPERTQVRAGVTNVTISYVDGRTKYTEVNGVRKQTYVYGAETDGKQWTKVYTGEDGPSSAAWSKSVTDFLGRTLREERPAFGGGTITNSYVYNSVGQLVESQVSSVQSQVSSLYAYDELGEQILQGRIEGGVTNWLSGGETEYEEADGALWQVRRSLAFPVDNDTAVTTSVQRVRLTGLGTNSELGLLTSESVSVDILGNAATNRTFIARDAKTVTQTVQSPDSTNAAVAVTVNGLSVSSTSKTSVTTTYAHDALGRQVSAIVDAASPPRSVGTFTHYNALGQVAWTEDASSNRTSYAYDPATGRQIAVTNALGQATHQHYDPEGRQLATWGATYPVAYEYDDQGRMTAMYTLRDSAVALTNYASFQSQVSSFDKTSWLYDEATGLLTNKLYADTNGTAYAYTPDGKLETRTWARGIVTTYRYDEATGAMTNIAYGGSAPDVSFVLDRLGRQTSITDGTGTRTFTYNDALQLAAETNVMGSIEWQYDSPGRGVGFTLGAGFLVGYAFDHVGRLAAVTSSVDSATLDTAYSFLPNADLIAGWSNNVGFAVARSFEAHRNLLLSVSNGFGGSVRALFDYQNDVLGRRTARIDDRAVTNLFAYDVLSQLTNAVMGANGFGYQYDPIGNRLTAASNAVTHLYTANALNQYTAITNGGLRALAYDLDGNLTNDTVFAYSWDGENRLIQVSNFQFQVSFDYDYMSRRYRKVSEGVTNTFLYDGWTLIQEVTHSPSHTLTNSYIWGLDLSGSLQGAGGIGGLLAVTRAGVTYFPCSDANGNITDYVTTNGTVVAHREYDAFGNTTVATGPLVHDLHHWFSSKYLDEETGLYYYGLRYYDPELGRWISRDPIGDSGFGFSASSTDVDLRRLVEYDAFQELNLFSMCWNRPVDMVDTLGLKGGTVCPPGEHHKCLPKPWPVGEPCCEEPCKLRARIEHLRIVAYTAGGVGATGYDAYYYYKVTASSGLCPISCLWWSCCMDSNSGSPVPTRGPSCQDMSESRKNRPTSEICKIKGILKYLSCDDGTWQEHVLPTADAVYHFKYVLKGDPDDEAWFHRIPGAWRKVWP